MKKTNVFHTTFPIISEVIDIELLRNDSIHRDMIISKLLDRSEIQALLPSLLEKNTKHNTPQKAIGNMVDWFSAEITKKKSNISIAYSNKYTRRKIKNNGRKVWEYSFSEGGQSQFRLWWFGWYAVGLRRPEGTTYGVRSASGFVGRQGC